MRTLLDLSRKEARKFFLRPKSYFSLELPSYFKFGMILDQVREIMQERALQDFYLPFRHPRHCENVNHALICSKDGQYAWRKHQIIHPFIYVGMVHYLTKADNWQLVCERAKALRSPKINCASTMMAPTNRLNKNEQDIFNWSGNFTNETIRKSLEYKYMLTTDLTSCYDTLPFHLLAWALHGRKCEYDPELVGWQLADFLQEMSYGQTCGVPQGSVLMDFFAEIMLSYIDCTFCGRLAGFPDVQVLRYRDDYRIFANNLDVAEAVMKILVETLAEFNLKINLAKTQLTTNMVKHALKPDRLAWKRIEPLIFGDNKVSILKSLLLIRDFNDQFPHCGSVKSALCGLYLKEIYDANCHEDIWQIAGILTDIMYRHAGTWAHCVAILSKYLSVHDKATTAQVVEHIQKKFVNVPNMEYLEIWLQRLSIKREPHLRYQSSLCKILHDRTLALWNSEWLDRSINLVDSDVISFAEIMAMPDAIPVEEAALFATNHGSG